MCSQLSPKYHIFQLLDLKRFIQIPPPPSSKLKIWITLSVSEDILDPPIVRALEG